MGVIEWIQNDRLDTGREEDDTTEVVATVYILVSAAIPIHILCNKVIPLVHDTVGL